MGILPKGKRLIIRITTGIAFAGLILSTLFTSVSVFSASNDANDWQSQIDAATQQMIILNKKIDDYQTQLKQAGKDKKTLQSAIRILDLRQGRVTTQIEETHIQQSVSELRLEALGSQIEEAQKNIDNYKNQIAVSLNALYKLDNETMLMKFLSANNFSDAWLDLNDILDITNAFRKKVDNLKTEKATLSDRQAAEKQQQQALADQNAQLASQQQTLDSTAKLKGRLLAVTQNKESNYQKLLAKAEAELNSYATFIKNAGGAKILGNETVCDTWGCYYNQRDEAWGGKALDGTGYTLASDGCLVTSMAMVMTHYGYRNVTPLTINANPDNFAPYAPAYLLKTISVDGVSATRISSLLDQTLAHGTPVIVELRVYGGTHFVVLVSGDNGHYTMRDPYLANGKDISFASHYNIGEIAAMEKVVINY